MGRKHSRTEMDSLGLLVRIHLPFHERASHKSSAALLNILENLANVRALAIFNHSIHPTHFQAIYLYLVYYKPSELAPLFGYTGATVTLAKTVLYTAQEYFCDACSTGHNAHIDRFLFFVIPNMYVKLAPILNADLTTDLVPSRVWTCLSGLVMYTLGEDIASSLYGGKLKLQ
jgi:hypothetical protein